MITSILSLCGSLGRLAKLYLRQWSKPVTATLVTGVLSDLTRSRTDLVAENLMLRQQLIVLKRQVKRPQLTNFDRIRLVLTARCTQFWQQALFIVQPDTLLRWHRDLFRRYWRRKSKNNRRQPRIAAETIALIRRMAVENRLWGAERIRGELLKLGLRVSKRTIQKYMPKKRRKPSQTWATFLKNHAADVWATDFAVAHDLLFRPL
jgi:putative transposase